MSNSPLVKYTKISPNKTSPRNHVIDTITIHCYVGQVSVEKAGEWFAKTSARASCNYVIGADGRIALIVDEKDRSWCSSKASNDHRAITIECASDTTDPYAINDKVYASLIELCADICKRNNIKELKWKADKSLVGQVDKQNMTVHRWFAAKACPGDYIYNRLGQITKEVNDKLNGVSKKTTTTTKTVTSKVTKKVTATGTADYSNKNLAGTYVTTANLHMRNDAGVSNKSLCVVPKGTKVKCYGYYSLSKGVNWLYVEATINKVKYTGFCSKAYLKK